MTLMREIPSDASAMANLADCFLGSSDWVFERRLAQFRGNLLATCDEVEQGIAQVARAKNIEAGPGSNGVARAGDDVQRRRSAVCKVKDDIRSATSWSETFRIEQSLVHLMSDLAVASELRRRRAELHRFAPALQAHYQFEIKNAIDDASADPDALRKLLFRLVKDMQWCDLNSFHHHVFVCQLTQRVNVVFTASMVAFFVLVMIMFSPLVVHSIYLYLAMTAGVFGASFSMLISLEARVEICDLDQLRSIRSWPSLLTRIFAGAGGGLLLYFFVLSGVLTMKGLPPLDTLAQCNGGCVQEDTGWGQSALFVLLAFVSGFIEKLIPGLIRTAGSKLNWTDTETSEIRP